MHDTASRNLTSSKPFTAQSRIFSLNSLLLSSQVQKSSAVVAGAKRHRKSYPLDYTASVIRIYDELKGQPDESFLKTLTTIFHRDEADVGAALLLAQTQARKGSLLLASGTLEKLFHALKDSPDVKFAPGLVSLAVSLFVKAGKEEKATALLLDAKMYWTKKGLLVEDIPTLS